MLDANVSPFYCDRHANTALIEAAREKRADVCRLLIARGLDADLFNRSRENAFDVAVGHRDGEILHAVAPSKSDAEVQEDEKALQGNAQHLLHLCVAKDDEAEILKELDAMKVPDVDVPTAGGERTALMIAASKGKLATVQKLLDLGADVKKQGVTDGDRLGTSAVTIAAEEGHEQVLKCARSPAYSRTCALPTYASSL